MPLASSSRLQVRYTPEAVFGTVPAAVANYPRALRITGESLNYALKKDYSKEIRADRNIGDLTTVDADVGGGVPAELSYNEFDDFIQAALMGTWVEINAGSGISATITLTTTITASAGTPFAALAIGMKVRFSGFTNLANNATITIATVSPTVITTAATLVNEGPVTVSFSSGGVANITGTTTATTIAAAAGAPFSNVAAGQWVLVSGFVNAGNNGWRQTTIAGTATTLTFAGGGTVETSVANVRVSGSRLINGTVQRSFSVEESFGDVVQFATFRGININKMTLDWKPGAFVGLTFDCIGKDQMPLTVTTNLAGSVVASTSNDIINAVTGVASVLEGGSSLTTPLKGINLVLDNTLRAQKGIGVLGNAGIGTGFAMITGKVDAYFDSATLYNKFVNNTASSLSWRSTDSANNGYAITLPKTRYSSGGIDASAVNQDVMVPLGVQGVYDPTTLASIIIDRAGVQTI